MIYMLVIMWQLYRLTFATRHSKKERVDIDEGDRIDDVNEKEAPDNEQNIDDETDISDEGKWRKKQPIETMLVYSMDIAPM